MTSKEYSANWRKQNPGKTASYIKKYEDIQKTIHPKEYYITKIFRERGRVAKKKQIPFSITLEYVLELPCTTCPIFEIPLTFLGNGTRDNSTPSLDRIIPKLGYVPGNVHWLSWRANSLKRDGTRKEFELLATWFKNNVPETY